MSAVNDELCWVPATELAARIRRREVTPLDVAEACLAQVERVNPQLNAIVHHDPDQVRRDARALTDALASDAPLGPLHGVPYTLKESAMKAGTPATHGIVATKDHVADHDETLVTRLERAGALFLGKTNLPEGGYCGGSTNHLYGATHNPWKHGMTAGGSSAGAGAAVASGMGQLAQGTDGGGSVRIPAAVSGVVGLKPSLGRIPESVLAGRHHTFVFHGPLARTVPDAALMLDVMAGPDASDPLSMPDTGERFLEATRADVSGLRIAYSPDLGFADVDPEIAAICADAVRAFEELGCRVEQADPGWPDPEQAMWEGLWAPTYASMLEAADWDRWAGQVDEQLIELMHFGAKVSPLDIARADAIRGGMWDAFARLMGSYDLLISPTLSLQTFPLDRFAPESLDGQPLRRQLLGWLMTYPFNMLGTPAISVPAGFTASGLPVGLQIAGGLHADAAVLQAAASFERVRPWTQHRPQLDALAAR